jgi:bilirubin oxidase
LLTLATSMESPVAPALLPSTLRPLPDLGSPVAQQRVVLSAVTGICSRNGSTVAFLINGELFDPERIDLVTTVGKIELWDIVNNTGMMHPFHIHGTQFQLVSRKAAGVVTPAPYLAWIDTVVVPAHQTATIKVRQPLPGKRMFHCHILEHEDACMMAILDVRPA